MHTPTQHLYRPSQDGEGLFYAWFSSMHTRVDIVLCSRKPEADLLVIANHIHDTLHRLEQIANYYDPASELAFVNRMAAFSPVVLSRELYDMLSMCLEYHPKTFGCFDITVHSNNYHCDTIRSVSLLSDERSIFFQQPGITLNLSGFLKGYALEHIRSILKDAQIENTLISMGNSSVLALGNHPMGQGWKIKFGNQPATETNNNPQSLHLLNKCLTTSGNESHGRKHIISPQSGKIVEGNKQIAVVTDNGAIGEILSTSLFVADREQREALITTFQPILHDLFYIGY